jgi:hypothetical protein
MRRNMAGVFFRSCQPRNNRSAAHEGNATVRAARAAVRAFFHWRDAVSVLEHAVSGLGMALVGVAVLQLYYFTIEPAEVADGTPPRWLRWGLPSTSAVPLAASCRNTVPAVSCVSGHW